MDQKNQKETDSNKDRLSNAKTKKQNSKVRHGDAMAILGNHYLQESKQEEEATL